MRSEPQLRHSRVVDQTALDHVPAQCSLRSAEQENPEQHRRQTGRRWKLSACDEPQQRHDEGEPDQAPEQAVDIFHPEYAFERVDAHAAIYLQVLRRRLILGKRFVPLRLGQRRQCADDGLPFGDRQARMRQARHAADHDQGEHQGAADEKPGRDRARITAGRRGSG